MKPRDNNSDIVDCYFALLENLDNNKKQALITKLKESMKTPKKANEISLNDLFGAFESDQTAEEIIAEIREDR